MDPWGRFSRLSFQEIRSVQNKKLRHFINTYLYPFSPHYRQLFDRNKINPKNIRTVEDLSALPFTSKTDFITTENKSEKFKEFILQPDQEKIKEFWPKSKLLSLAWAKLTRGDEHVTDRLTKEYKPVFITFTTGTTNDPVPYAYTQYDVDNLSVSGARMFNLFGIKQNENLVNMFPFAPHLAFWQVAFGGLAAGALILSTGGGKVMGTEGNVAVLMRMKPSVILGVPSYVYHVLRRAHEKGHTLDFVRTVVLGASRVTPAFKLRLISLLESMGARDVAVLGTYGFTEARCAWAESRTQDKTSSGYYLYPDKEIFEVVDPKTGKVQGEGEDGELVYTSIDARGSTVLRYRTGDFVRGGIIYSPCPHTGLTVPRISSDITRLSDVKDLHLSKVKGCLVNLNNFSTLLNEMETIQEWQVEIRKKDNDPFEVDELIVYVSPKNGADRGQLESAIRKNMLVSTEVSPNEVRFLPLDEIVKRLELETASKEKRILDTRPKG